MDGNKGKGLTAASAGRVQRRVKPVRLIAEAATYKIQDQKTGEIHEGTLKMVLALCPGIKQSTLKRRLDSGERTLGQLRRKPKSAMGRSFTKGGKRT